ncbi:Cyclopropane-fatty-acyl-phospholipid synthase [Hordeum vulgare]|nr:Cyclopropane-fatty-acyl-phospholipid synthase [Hordeum vulgare]
MWRFAHNSHPLLRNVERHGVELDNTCIMCSRLPEDGAHLFLKCKQVKQVWRAGSLERTRQALLLCQTPKDMLATIFKMPEPQKLRVLCLLWCWWSERNKVNQKKRRMSAESLVASVNFTSMEWVEFLGRKEPEPKHAERWKPPPADYKNQPGCCL